MLKKLLEKLQSFYSNRGINLVCISKKWSFRTSDKLSNLLSKQKTIEKKFQKQQLKLYQLLFIINLLQELKLKILEV